MGCRYGIKEYCIGNLTVIFILSNVCMYINSKWTLACVTFISNYFSPPPARLTVLVPFSTQRWTIAGPRRVALGPETGQIYQVLFDLIFNLHHIISVSNNRISALNTLNTLKYLILQTLNLYNYKNTNFFL